MCYNRICRTGNYKTEKKQIGVFMAFLKNKAFPMAVRTGMALAAMLFFTACGKEQDNNTVLYIDDNPVSREEYEMLAQENCNQIYMKYSTDEVNSKDFWTTEKDGETPAKQLEENILEQLKENYAVKEAAKDLKVTEDYSYQELMEQKEEKSNSDYGLQEYKDEEYYKYWYSNLKTDVINQWVKENGAITDEACNEYYKENIENFTYEVGVNILYTEIPSNSADAEQEAQEIYQTLLNEPDAEAAVSQYANADTQKLELTSLNTQEGASGVYTNRWQIASQMQTGEVCQPYEENGMYCIIKCIERKENGTIDYDTAKASIERYLQVQAANKYLEEKENNLQVKDGKIKADQVIQELFEK